MGAGEAILNPYLEGILAEITAQYRQSFHTVRFALATIFPAGALVAFKNLQNYVLSNQINLKIHWSLHTVDPERRKAEMPRAGSNINEVREFMIGYHTLTGNTEVHCTAIAGLNNRDIEIGALCGFLFGSDLHCKVLKHNKEGAGEGQDIFEVRLAKELVKFLRSYNISAEYYASPGEDISASCGMFIRNAP